MAKKEQPPDDSAARGKAAFDTMFTSLSIILLAFFIMLNTFSTMDARKVRVTYGSLAGSFGFAMGGSNAGDPGTNYMHVRAGLIDSPDEMSARYRRIEEYVEELGLTPYVEVIEEHDHRLLRFREALLFPSGGDVLSPTIFPVLDRLAELARVVNRPLRIEGHTDPVTPRGDMSNWGLSASRAVAVMRFLTEAAGVSEKLVSAVGKGASAPLGDPDDPKDFARSRRVDVYFL